MLRHIVSSSAQIILLLNPATAGALTVVPPCKDRIVQILSRVDALPAHEEIRTTVTEAKEDGASAYAIVATKKSVIKRIAPDRFSITMWKNDELRAESISIGRKTWDREPGAEWTLEKPAKPGSPDAFIDDFAARLERAGKAVTSAIEAPMCHGHVDYAGRQALSYTYRYFIAQAQLWIDAETGMPIEERMVSAADAARTRTTVIRRFRYDPSLIIGEPR